jgi:quercetin dioxygenase-like cupin family protein
LRFNLVYDSGAKVDQGFEAAAGFVDLTREPGRMAMPRSITTFRQVLVAAAVLTAAALLAAPGASAAGGDTGVTVQPLAAHDLPNLPGKRLTAIVVTYAPGAKSARHHHAGSVWAYVLSGAIRSQNSATGPAKVYRAGESFFEPPGSEHLVSENASATESASLPSVHIADDGAAIDR